MLSSPIVLKMPPRLQMTDEQLGWLIDRSSRRVYIYRPAIEVECLENPDTVSGDRELPGFVLNLSKIW